jgi:multiple sugar transport system permease protein
MADALPGAVAEPGSMPVAAAAPTAPSVAPASAGESPQGRRASAADTSVWVALLWLGPALALIIGVVVFPAYQLVKAAFSKYSITGLRLGDAGTTNFKNVLNHPLLVTVLTNTVIWVVVVVALTVLVSLALAQFLAKDFFGRKVVRWAIIVPWAASLVITAKLFTLIYDYYYGTLNMILQGLHITSGPIDFLGDDRWTMPSMIMVGIFVSVPFTAYVFVAGLNAIPGDVYEAAKIDGAGPWQTYWRITLPLLRPALVVASVLNIIYVFNSFPIIYTLNDRNPGFLHDTTITFMYKLAFKSAEKDVGMSAAAGIFNVVLILIVIAIYLRTLKWQEQED